MSMSAQESPAIAEKAGMVALPAASKETVDVEVGKPDAAATSAATAAALYPNMTEDPRLRWMFIRKVYAIIGAQFVFTAGVASVIFFVHPIPDFLRSRTLAALGVFIAIMMLPLLGNRFDLHIV